MWRPLGDGREILKDYNDCVENKLAHYRWLERERLANLQNHKIYGLIKSVHLKFTLSPPRPNFLGLKFGQWLGFGIRWSDKKILPVLSELSLTMKNLAQTEKINVFPRDFLTQMYDGFRFLGKTGTEAVLLLAQVATGDEDNSSSACLIQFVKAWEELCCEAKLRAAISEDGIMTDYIPPTLEMAAARAKVSYAKLSGALAESAMLYGSNLVRMIIHTSIPEVARAIVEDAIDPESRTVKSMELAAKVGGLIDSGARVQINNNQLVQSGGGNGLAGQFPVYVNAEELIAAKIPGVNSSKQLPQGDLTNLVDAEVIQDAVVVES